MCIRDRLYDDYDPDCTCEPATEPLSYLSNGDFEQIDACCNSMDSDDLVCLEDWFLVTLSPDYLSPSCPPSDLDLLQNLGIPFSGGFIGMGASTVGGFLRTEAMGTCLEAPLKSCREYTISFQSLILSTLDYSTTHDSVEYVIYGLPGCPLATDLDVTQSFCDNPLFDQAEELISFDVMQDSRDEWIRHVTTFIPSSDINSIVIYVRCGQDVQVQTGNIPFVFFDDFEFLIGPVDCIVSGAIEVTGDPCFDDYTFSAANVVNAETYQWYKDSIPIIGATNNIYQPPTGDVSGHYSVYISNNVECAFVDGGRITANQTATIQLLDTICSGEFVLFGLDTLRETGNFSRSISSSTGGCDEIETLSLYVIPDMPIQLLDTICSDEFVLFGLDTLRETGDFSRSISSSTSGCDEIETLSLYVIPDMPIQLLDTICSDEFVLFGLDTLRETGDFSRSISSSTTGCNEIETLSLYVIPDMPIQLLDTICSDEYVLFGTDTIREAGNYTRALSNSGGCTVQESLSLYVIPDVSPDIIFDPGLNVTVGNELVLTPSDLFLDQITGYMWLENGVEVNQGNPVLTSSVSTESDVSYSFIYTHGKGCTQTVSFTVEWTLPMATQEDCTNNIDDDLDGLVDTFDDDCMCSTTQSQVIELDAQICQGESYDFCLLYTSDAADE